MKTVFWNREKRVS